mmetsp:Transcript_24775/g.32367  ORF Transcript_24775/g.32367 Transcript_24775/m.32367 type:complete len:528 (+) Transcript_24775:117-1700(+)
MNVRTIPTSSEQSVVNNRESKRPRLDVTPDIAAKFEGASTTQAPENENPSASILNNQSIQKSEVSRFILQTYEIFNSKDHAEICGWGDEEGTTVVVHDVNAFQNTVLPKFFKHQNYQSFVRQLNLYGFHKTEKDPSRNVFKHPFFQRDREELMPFIKRKNSSAACDRKGADLLNRTGRNDSRKNSNQQVDQRLQMLESARFQSEAETKLIWEHVLALNEKVKITEQKIERVVQMMFQVFQQTPPSNTPALEKPTTANLHRNAPPPPSYPTTDSLPNSFSTKIEPYAAPHAPSRVQAPTSASEPSILSMLFQLTGSTAERPLQLPQQQVTSQPFSFGAPQGHFGIQTPSELTTYNGGGDSSLASAFPPTTHLSNEPLATSKGVGSTKRFLNEPSNDDNIRSALSLLNSLNTQSAVSSKTAQPWPPATFNAPAVLPASIPPIPGLPKVYGQPQPPFPSAVAGNIHALPDNKANNDGKEIDNKMAIRNVLQVANQDRSSSTQIDKLEEILGNFVKSMHSNPTSNANQRKI